MPFSLESSITGMENDCLNAIPSANVVRRAIFSINPNKAPSPVSFNGKFYQNFWNILKQDFQGLFYSFFSTGTLDPRLNETVLVLIPKRRTGDNQGLQANKHLQCYLHDSF